ncbi:MULTISPECIES: Tautomerase enzyme [Burkholderia]|uniref:Tautomerase enzyme n=1 Tax=Burkholderia TaxID=32008 RepID=UPI000F5B45C0|nr:MULTISPECIES: Tautomerase enzyme [Burkholderia]MBN3738418.1 Tautomerase enzyme [Burkholderia sp. Tr-20355]RQS85009.1 Tautomerase enzyme [Burkholderia seminalis]
MPMIDVTLPEGALAPHAEAQLMNELTGTLIRHEGLDPDDPRVRDVTWIFVHRPAAVYRAGAVAPAPLYRIVPTVPEGQYTDAARAALIADVTAAVARAEGAAVDAVATRVWVFPTEIDDGCWGSRGTVRRLPDIMEYFGGATLRALGEQRLATKRRADAGRVVDAVRDSMREMDRNGFHEPAAGVVR